MTKYLNLEEVSLKRGETPFKVARMLTRKECKLFLHFGGDGKKRLYITEKMINDYYHLFQGENGFYPMTLKSQHECVERLSNSNFDLSGLSFMVGKDEIRLRSVDDEDRSVCVVVLPEDVEKLPPLSNIDGGLTVTGVSSPSKFFSDENFHQLVLRTMRKEGTSWNIVKRNLSKHTLEGEKIKNIEVSNHEGDMRPQIQFSTEDSIEPYKVMESTFQKKLTAYRKHLKKLPLPGNV